MIIYADVQHTQNPLLSRLQFFSTQRLLGVFVNELRMQMRWCIFVRKNSIILRERKRERERKGRERGKDREGREGESQEEREKDGSALWARGRCNAISTWTS